MTTETQETISESFPESFEDWLRRSLSAADSLLDPEVAERILAQGEAAVVPLIEILEDRSLLVPTGGWAPIHAAVLLGELGAGVAIPALLEALVDEDDGDLFTDEATESLVAMGPVVLEPVLQVHAELLADGAAEGANPYYLMDLERILCSLGVQDERIFTALIGALERTPEHAACCLTLYGDERAIEPLRQAFDQCDLEADVWSMDIEAASEIRDAIEELGGSLAEEQERRYQRARERLLAKVRSRFGRDGAATESKQKRRASRKQRKASRKKNRR
jgi:HEAT repeat protein